MIVNFSFIIDNDRAQAFVAELTKMHASLPQPATGSTRVLNIYGLDTENGTQHNADLEYYDRDNKVIMGYYLTIDSTGSTVVYVGNLHDFGGGDVGPYMGIQSEITDDLRIRGTPVVADGIYERTAETHRVIRDTDGNGELDYGEMSLYELDGIQFVARSNQAKYLRGAVVVPVAEIPAFLGHITLRAVISVHYAEVWIYVLKKEDIRPLAAKLSVGRRITACGWARLYAAWLDGRLTNGPTTMSTFYLGVTPEQEELFRF